MLPLALKTLGGIHVILMEFNVILASDILTGGPDGAIVI
jgi:hypothetical protein